MIYKRNRKIYFTTMGDDIVNSNNYFYIEKERKKIGYLKENFSLSFAKRRASLPAEGWKGI